VDAFTAALNALTARIRAAATKASSNVTGDRDRARAHKRNIVKILNG